MRILITGISGFVARHFLTLLNNEETHYEVMGIYNNNIPDFEVDEFPNLTIYLRQLNLLNKGLLNDTLIDFYPERIIHLAAQSSVAKSWVHPAETVVDNTTMFLNLIEVIREAGLRPRILSVGSSEEYGKLPENETSLRENLVTNPQSPYGMARTVQRKMMEMYHHHFGLDILHTRSFNHFGPYQTSQFVIPSFARQVAEQFVNGRKVIELSAGNVEISRDFTDVRDVVKAYQSLFNYGKAGETYNVCSGHATYLKDIIKMMGDYVGRKVEITVNPEFFRPTDNLVIAGSNQKIYRDTGWKPLIPFEQSIKDIVDFWIERSKHLVKAPLIKNN